MLRFTLPWLLQLTLASAWLNACSSNIFEEVDKGDPADKATAYMDEGKVDEAIRVLNNALQSDQDNYQLISILSTAKAQKAGVDTLDIALKLATGGEEDEDGAESEGNDNAMTALMEVLPTATTEVRGLMLESVNLLDRIPNESRTNADTFKATLYNAAFTALQAKFFDGDGDGTFTVEELANLDDASASAILDSLLNAETAAAYYQGEGETNTAAAGQVAEIQQQINNQPGENTAEKLRNYLASSGGGQPSP